LNRNLSALGEPIEALVLSSPRDGAGTSAESGGRAARSTLYDLCVSTRADSGEGGADVRRRLVVPGSLTLDDLHLCIRLAFGRTEAPDRCYVFGLGTRRFVPLDAAVGLDDDRIADAEFTRLDEVGLEPGARMQYVYDLMAGHDHSIEVCAVRATPARDLRPRCPEGTGTIRGGPSQPPDLAAIDAALARVFASLGPGAA
jgi:hypothetical protein